MGRPGLRPLTGRAPAPADSEGFSEPNPTTDRAVNPGRIGFRTADVPDNEMIDPRVVQPVTRVMPKGTSAATAAAEPARDGATTTPHALPRARRHSFRV